jgi:exoribonuclease R
MAILETATAYILGIITENEEVKKFPKDFVSASMRWIRSWFLEDDPKLTAKLAEPNRSEESKKTLIESKLEDLEGNEAFQKELTEQLQAYTQHKARIKNVLENVDVEAEGSVHIGDKGNRSDGELDKKNVVKGGKIKAGKDFRLGDDIY